MINHYDALKLFYFSYLGFYKNILYNEFISNCPCVSHIKFGPKNWTHIFKNRLRPGGPFEDLLLQTQKDFIRIVKFKENGSRPAQIC